MIVTTDEATFTATIYVGFKETLTGNLVDVVKVYETIQKYVDQIGLCVTVTPTSFVYTRGGEEGLAIGFINYPRFPSTPEEIMKKANDLGLELLAVCKQINISIVFPDRTIMLTDCERKAEVAKARISGYEK
jgi:hypothetical protein